MPLFRSGFGLAAFQNISIPLDAGLCQPRAACLVNLLQRVHIQPKLSSEMQQVVYNKRENVEASEPVTREGEKDLRVGRLVSFHVVGAAEENGVAPVVGRDYAKVERAVRRAAGAGDETTHIRIAESRHCVTQDRAAVGGLYKLAETLNSTTWKGVLKFRLTIATRRKTSCQVHEPKAGRATYEALNVELSHRGDVRAGSVELLAGDHHSQQQ